MSPSVAARSHVEAAGSRLKTTESGSPRMRVNWLLIAILSLGGLLRVVFFRQFSGTPFSRHLLLDCSYYQQMAQAIADGHLIQERAFFLGPLYPYALGLLYTILGSHSWVAPAFQMALGLGTCALVYSLGARVAGRVAGLIAALACAAFKPALFYEQTILMETALTFLCLALVSLVVWRGWSARPVWWLAIGALSGACALMRGNTLLFLPAIALWLIVTRGKIAGPQAAHALIARAKNSHAGIARANASSSPAGARPLLLRLVFLGAGALLVILPATVHNLTVERGFVLISSNDGINLFIGNQPGASGCYEPPPGVEMSSDMPGFGFVERATGKRPVTSAEASAYWRSRAFDAIRSDPWRAFALAARKAYHFWGSVELDQIFILGPMRTLMPALAWPLVSFRLIAPFALLGLFLILRRRDPRLFLLGGLILVYFCSLLPFFMTSRYRLPVVPLLAICAGLAVEHLIERIRRRQWKLLGAWAAAALALFLVMDNGWAVPPRQDEQVFHNSLGLFHLAEGKLDLAQREFELAAHDGGAAEISANLAWVHFLKKDYAEAIAQYEKAHALRPESAETCFRLGLAHLCLRHLPEARAYMEKALALDPDGDPLCLYNLALVYAEQGEPARAATAMRAYLEKSPNDGEARRLFQRYLELARSPS